MAIPLPNRLQDTFVTCLTSVGIRDARVCLQVDSVAENWFAFLVLSTCTALLELKWVCGLCSWSPAMLSLLLLLSTTAFQPTLADQVHLSQVFKFITHLPTMYRPPITPPPMASFLLLRLNQSIVLLVCLVPVLPGYALPNIFNYSKPHYYPSMTSQVL